MSVKFLYFELITVTVMKLTTFHCRKNASFSFCIIDKTCIYDVLSESPLNTGTRIIRTLWHVLLASVLTGFYSTLKKLYTISGISVFHYNFPITLL